MEPKDFDVSESTDEVTFGFSSSDQTDSTHSGSGRRSGDRLGPETFRPVLICLAGPLRGQRRALVAKDLVIGRSSRADWRLNDTAASRQHARVIYENFENPDEMPRCYIEDIESRNGTEVNGRVIEERVQLQERDRILVGSTVVGFFIRDEAELRQDESLYESATRDALTGLDNRRQLLVHLRHHIARAERNNAKLAFLLADLDHFKNVNDRHGHDIGDEALRHVANQLRADSRESDLVARWGGEEFAICLPDTNAEAGHLKAERLREAVASTELITSGVTLNLTISIGGTTFRSGDTAETIFQRADKMLYRAKEMGRNRVEFYDSATSSSEPGLLGDGVKTREIKTRDLDLPGQEPSN